MGMESSMMAFVERLIVTLTVVRHWGPFQVYRIGFFFQRC